MKPHFKSWRRKIWKSFTKNFPLSLINIILIFVFMYIATYFVLDFGIPSLLGYLLYSILNLNKLIENPTKSLAWGIMYIISAIIFDIFLVKVIPLLSKGEGASLFSGIVILFLLIYLWFKKEKLK